MFASRPYASAVALPCLALASFLFLSSAALAAPGAALSCPTPASGSVLNVGPSGAFSTIGAAVSSAASGDTICVAAGLYQNDFFDAGAKNLTIVGVGGLAHLEATENIPNGKAIIVSSGNLTLKSLELSGARVSSGTGGNGAGIRYEGGNLTVVQSYFHDNQEGILGGAGRGDVVVRDSKFVDNGQSFFNSSGTNQTDLGQVHGIYLTGANSLTVDNSYFDSTHVGHHVKVVSPITGATITNSTFEDGGGPASTLPSYSIDAPGGGQIAITNDTLIQRPNAPNSYIVHNDYRQATQLPATNSMTIEQDTVRNQRSGGTLLLNNTTDPTTVAHNTLEGVANIATGSVNAFDNTSVSTPHAFAGPLLGIAGADGEGQIAEFDGSGATTGGLPQPSGIVGNTGIASLGQNIFVANRYQGVGVFDPVTGTSTLYHGPQGIEGLGTYQNTLIAGVFDNDSIVQFGIDMTVEPHPTEMGTLMLHLPTGGPIGITGLDSNNSTIFYVGSYDSGDVYEFDPTGTYLGSIMTDLGAGVLSGLAYDRGNDTLWLSTGYGNNGVYHYDLLGNLLGTFAAPIAGMGGLDVFADNVIGPSGPPTVPEPPTLTIFALALLGLTFIRQRGSACPRRR